MKAEDKARAEEKYKEFANADFSKMTVDEIKLNITARIKQLEIILKPKL